MKKAKLSISKVRLKDSNGKKVPYWKVISPKLGGGSTRRFFKAENDAITYFQQQKQQIGNYGLAGASLNERLRGQAIAADEILAPLGLDLVDAAKHYAAFITSSRGGIPLTDAVALLVKDREADIYSEEYRKSLKLRLKHFVEYFPKKTTTQITPTEIQEFLRTKKSVETRKSYRRNIKTLFQFLIDFHNHSTDPVPDLEQAKTIKETKWSVAILTPDHCERLLRSATPETLPSLALGMFCGLRASEIARLDWKYINIEEKRIRITEDVARKVGSKRSVPIPEACIAWIKSHTKKEGSVEPENFRDLFDEVRIAAGFRPSNTRTNERLIARGNKLKEWPSNCLRHSAISYGLAECDDESKVATWAGNSPKMIKQHYDGQAYPSDAKKFFSILPKRVTSSKTSKAKAA
jgi:integrase